MAIFSKSSTDVSHNALPTEYYLSKEYRIEKILGDGGFGITYLAWDNNLNCYVALKEYLPNDIAIRNGDNLSIYPKSTGDETAFNWGLNCFIQEAKTLAQFNHPNIVRVRRFFESLNTAYIVMDYEEGESLDALLSSGETADEKEIQQLLKPLLNGLEVVHDSGCLHRDIKPGNIYIRDKDNSPVLLDFGSARYDVNSRSRSITAIVTPGYAPFEQYESQGATQGAWTDIYSIGAVLYRLISAKVPVEATERIGAIVRGNSDPLVPAVEIGKGRYSQHLLEAIDWALKIKEKERPQSIKEWREKLFPKHDIPKPNPITKQLIISLLLAILAGAGGYYVATLLSLTEPAVINTEVFPESTSNKDSNPVTIQPAIQPPEEQGRSMFAALEKEAQEQERERLAAIERERLRREKELVNEVISDIRRIQERFERNVRNAESENQVIGVAEDFMTEIQKTLRKLEQEAISSENERQVERTLKDVINEMQRQAVLRIASIEEALSRCSDGRLNAAQIEKLVTNKIAIGKRIDVSVPYSWQEGQVSGGRAYFQKKGRNASEGRWKINYNQLCWCYGTCSEYKCKYVEARNNCSVWYYIDPETGEGTGKVTEWRDID